MNCSLLHIGIIRALSPQRDNKKDNIPFLSNGYRVFGARLYNKLELKPTDIASINKLLRYRFHLIPIWIFSS